MRIARERQQPFSDPALTFGYKLELDVVYGRGRIAPNGAEVMRDLKMDVYMPTSAGAGPWPAVVYVHGGAWHRGGRRNPPYSWEGRSIRHRKTGRAF